MKGTRLSNSLLLIVFLWKGQSHECVAFPTAHDCRIVAPNAMRGFKIGSPAPSLVPLQAFGLPDERRRIVDNDGGDDDEEDENDVAASLVKKLAKSKEKVVPSSKKKKEKDNDAMSFLKKMGKVGGAANKNFVNAVGSDEGSTGRQPTAARDSGGGVGSGFKKDKLAYQECTVSGTIDDMTEVFPYTSSGSEWRGISDRVMGGLSDGFVKREVDLEGRPANVLTGRVSLKNNGGFIQMVTDLDLDPVKNSVDASEYDGIELDALFRNVNSNAKKETDGEEERNGAQSFNVHLRTPGTFQQASYRHTFELSHPDQWETILIPFSSFSGGYDITEPLDISTLRRIGIVSKGKETDVFLAIGGVRLYSVI